MKADKPDLRLLSRVTDVTQIPARGRDLVIVATVKSVLHFRIFNHYAQMVVDIDEKRLPAQGREIEDLRRALVDFWPILRLTESQQSWVITLVTSIVGYPGAGIERGPIALWFATRAWVHQASSAYITSNESIGNRIEYLPNWNRQLGHAVFKYIIRNYLYAKDMKYVKSRDAKFRVHRDLQYTAKVCAEFLLKPSNHAFAVMYPDLLQNCFRFYSNNASYLLGHSTPKHAQVSDHGDLTWLITRLNALCIKLGDDILDGILRLPNEFTFTPEYGNMGGGDSVADEVEIRWSGKPTTVSYRELKQAAKLNKQL